MPETTFETKAKILVVDDEVLIAADLSARLKGMGYTVSGMAANCKQALELVERHRPDLVIMDIVIQGEMDGIETAEVIRDRWDIPVIFLTAYTDSHKLERANLAHPFGYLLKPYQDKELEVAVGMALYAAKVDSTKFQAEKSLRRETTWRKMLVHGSRDGIVVLDQTGKVYEANRKFADLLGYKPDEILDLYVWDWDAQWDKVHLLHMIETVGEQGDCFITRHRRKDGTLIDVEISTNAALREDEKLVFCVCRDITQRKHAEESLRQSEERYRTILEIAMDGFCLIDQTGLLLEVNESYCNMTGYTEQELLSMNLNDLEAVETADATASHMQKVISEGKDRFESRHRRKDGSLFDVEVSVQYSSINGGIFAAFLRDITDKKHQHENLRFQAMVLDQIQDHVTVTDLDGQILFVNQAVADSIGRPKNELIGQSTTAYGEDPMQGATQKEIVEKTTRDGSWRGEVVNYSADGSEIIFDCRTQVIHDQQGNPASLCGIATDITERKQAEEQLRASEECYRLMADNTVDSIWAMDSELRFTYISPSTESLFGYALEEWRDLDWGEFVHPEYLDEVHQLFARIQQRETDNVAAIIKIRRKNNVELWVEFRAAAIRGRAGQVSSIVGISRDITELKKAEETLRASEAAVRNKLKAILEPESDLSVLALEDIIDVPAVQSLMETFHQISGMGSAIVDSNGKVLVGVGWQDICTKFHRCHPETSKNCIESDTVLARGSERGKFKSYLCKNGLWDMASPIDVSGRHMGNIYFGQFFYADEEPDIERFLDQARRYGFSEAEYLAALSRVPHYDREAVQKIMTFYSKLGEMISSLSYSNVSLSRTLMEREKAEAALRKSKIEHQDLLSRLPIGVYRNTPGASGRFIMANETIANMFGYDSTELFLECNVSDLYTNPSDRKTFSEALLNKGSLNAYELHLLKKDGTPFWGAVSARVVRDEGGSIKYFDGIIEDVTERKEAIESLKKSEDRFAQMFEHMGSGVAVYEAADEGNDFVFKAFNSSAERITRISKAQAIGHRLLELFPHMDKSGLLGSLQRVWETGDAEHLSPFYYKDDVREGWRENRIYKLPSGEVVAIFDDVTDRIEAEHSLRLTMDRLKLSADAAGFGVWDLDLKQNILVWDDWMYRLYGVEPKEFDGAYEAWQKGVHPEDVEQASKEVELAISGEKEFDTEFRVVHPDGEVRYLKAYGKVTLDENGDAVRMTGVNYDITDRKQAEAALRDSEERFRGIFKSSPIGIAIVDTATQHFLQANESFLKIVGYSMEELQTLKVGDITVQDDWKIEKNLISDYLNAQINKYELVKRYKRKDGETRYVQINGDVLQRHDGEPPLAVANVLDITDRLKAEKEKDQLQAQLQQAQKMEAVGTLAGGVAHDFNNLLQAINGYTQLILMEKSDKDPEYNSLKAIQDAGFRASDLVRQLLLFSRKTESTKRPIELQHEVERAKKMLERTIPKMIEISIFCGTRLWAVNADPIQIEQLLLNLGTNATDAMPDGGKLLFEVENATLDDDFVGRHTGARPGRYLQLKVSDTGHGMDKETMEHIFDPFFTTKEFGKGTGLGLASVYGIVQSHGGYIACRSEIGRGTTFEIYFPAIVQPETEETEDAEPKPIKGGAETILLVDDEEAIRGFAQQALMKFGYKLLAASTGEEALGIYSSESDVIDLVVMDLGMPGMGGHKCLQELLKINPELRVIIASGYSINDQVKRSMEAGARGYVGKPYQLADLLNTVRAVLDEG